MAAILSPLSGVCGRARGACAGLVLGAYGVPVLGVLAAGWQAVPGGYGVPVIAAGCTPGAGVWRKMPQWQETAIPPCC